MINNFFAHACSAVNDNELEKRCSINGYVSQFQVYVGTETSAETCLGARVVKDLTQNIVGKHHHIFCDNFFTSVKLFTELREVGVYATGTLRADRRGFPHDIKGSAKKGFKKKGECKIRRSRLDTNLSVYVWQGVMSESAIKVPCPMKDITSILFTPKMHM